MAEVFFGPSGRGKYEESKIEDIPKILCETGLKVFEYSFGRGVRMSDSTAKMFGDACAECGVLLSVHAPYFINLANPDLEMIKKSFGYFEECLKKMKVMGATRLVFHPASLSGNTREHALALAHKNLTELIKHLRSNNLIEDGVQLCVETMGKHGQLGTVEEVVELCKVDPCLIPTLDFGHINAFTLGGLKSQSDFEEVFSKVASGLGARGKNVHIHFSKIEYTAKGEKRHLNFCDPGEPDYKLMLAAMKKLGISGRVVSESAGHQVEDSLEMKNFYKNLK